MPCGLCNLTFGEVIPVGFSEFAGVSLVETESLQDGQNFPMTGCGLMEGRQGIGGVFRDMLEVSDAEVLYRYGDMFYDGFAAVTRKQQGNGMIYYIGCGVDEETMQTIMDRIMEDNGIEAEPTEDGVEVCCRGEGENAVRMIMNHNGYEAKYGERVLKPYESCMEKVKML